MELVISLSLYAQSADKSSMAQQRTNKKARSHSRYSRPRARSILPTIGQNIRTLVIENGQFCSYLDSY